MSNRPFNPNAFKVEELFRAKKERRRELAKLPFEQKIEILKRLQQVPIAAQRNEKLIFASFLEAHSELRDAIAEWEVIEEWYRKHAANPPNPPFDKRPDIIAITKSGRKIGVELKSWVNREQITAARKQERIQENILRAIGEQPGNQTRRIGYVRLAAKQARFDPKDASDFRMQMFGLIEQADNDWPQDEHQRDHEYPADLQAFPILEKYLTSAKLEPVKWRHVESKWIGFPSPGGACSPSEMLEILGSSLLAHRSDERYKDLGLRVGLDEVHLLVHYDFKAFAYNTPFAAPNFGFKEAAAFASEVLNGDGGYFDRIFLFHFLWNEEEAYEIFPELKPLSKR